MSLKEKILIADDSEMNQMLLEEILSDKYEYVMAKEKTTRGAASSKPCTVRCRHRRL